jgi:DNA-binding NarL/FixJ family response regulator
VRVVLAEDLYLLREGLTRLLEAHEIEVVAAVEDGSRLQEAIDEHRPDLVIVDVRLPPSFTNEGIEAAAQARRRRPGLPILILSQHVEHIYARELLAGDAEGIGYLLKDRVFSDEQFIDSVHRVASGGTVMDPQVVSKILAGSEGRRSLLTERERHVLELIAAGRSNAAISQELHLSESAVSKHTARIFDKLRIPPSDRDNRRVLAVLAYLDGAR